jgi:hypothetical protein
MTKPGAKYVRTLLAGSLLMGGAVVSSLAVGVLPAGAAAQTVTDCSGSPLDSGSLPHAVATAASGDTIAFAEGLSCPPTSPILLTSTIVIDKNLTITGPGPTLMAVSGGNAVGVLQVELDTVAISGLTIEDGSAEFGAGIDSSGNLTVTDSTVSDNSTTGTLGTTGSDHFGGGILTRNGSLTVVDSTVSGNVAPSAAPSCEFEGAPAICPITGTGGGIASVGSQTTVTDSTLSDDSAGSGGGGIWTNGGTLTVTGSTVSGDSTSGYAPYTYGYGGGIDSAPVYPDNVPGNGTVHISDSTVSDNSAATGGGGIASGGIFSDGTISSGSLTVTNTTVSGNSSGGGVDNLGGGTTLAATIVAGNSGSDCSGTVTDGGYNLDDDGSCRFSGTSLSATPSGLDPTGLQDNGGPTQTVALEPGSPAIGRVTDPSDCPPADQRAGANTVPCDAGAVNTDADPSLATSAGAGGTLGSVDLEDTGTLSGGSDPTGSLTFDLYDPGDADCTGTPTYTQVVPVSGDGSYPTSNSTPADAIGTWNWTAHYSGNADNVPATTSCNADPVTVRGPGSVSLVALVTLPATSGPVGYQATVSGTGPTPTGSVTISDGQGGSCTIASLGSGSGGCAIDESASLSPYTVTASYSGDNDYFPSAGTITVSGAVSTDGTATTSTDQVTATATGGTDGVDTVGEAQYGTDPVGSLTDGTNYFDVDASPHNTFSRVVVQDCNDATTSTLLTWWNPSADGGEGAWQPVVGDPGPTYAPGPPACVSASLDDTTSPSVSQLNGTVFGASTVTHLTVTTSYLPGGARGVPYSTRLTAFSGNAPYTWKLAAGKLPKGLKLNKRTGVIAGTPNKSSESSTFTVEVLDTKTKTKPKTQHTATAVLTIPIS